MTSLEQQQPKVSNKEELNEVSSSIQQPNEIQKSTTQPIGPAEQQDGRSIGAPAADTILQDQSNQVQGAELRDDVDKARAAGNTSLLDELQHQEWMNVAGSYLKAHTFGYDPLVMVDGKARYASPEVIEPFVGRELARRQGELKQLRQDMPEVGERKNWFDKQMELWKAENEAPMAKWDPNLPEDELAVISDQFKKKELPEDLVQDTLYWLNEYQNRAREIDPRYDINNDPELGYIAKSLRYT